MRVEEMFPFMSIDPLKTVPQTAEGAARAAALEAPLELANTTVNTWCQRI